MSEESQTSIQKINFMSICDMAESNTNKISIDKYHIDIMGDLAGAAFLTQLRYWFSPTTKSKIKGNTRVGIKREGKLWLAKRDVDWWDECYVTPKQVRRIKAQLIKLKIVEIRVFKFSGAPMVHYHMNLQRYAQLYHDQRVMNAEKESCRQKEREKKDMNRKSRRDSAQRAKSNLPKGQDGSCPKGQNINISSSHLLSSYNLKNHMENVSLIQNEKKMSLKLKGKPLQDFNRFGAGRQASYLSLVTLPPSTEGGELFNPVQAMRIASIFTPEEVLDGLKVLEEHVKAGNNIKKIGSYVTWILETALKPQSPNVKLNKDFWGSVKNSLKHLDIIEHKECIEIDDMTAFYFWMDHEQFKKGLTESVQNR